MRITIKLFLLVSMLSGRLNAQTLYPDCLDGVIYFKVLDHDSMVPGLGHPLFAPLAAVAGGTELRPAFKTDNLALSKIYRLSFANLNLTENLLTAISQLPGIEYAEKAPLYRLSYSPNDYNGPVLWYLSKVQAPQAWDRGKGSQEISIAVIDNAINYKHEDIEPSLRTNPNEIPGNNKDDDVNGYTDDVWGYDVADNDNNALPPQGITNSSFFTHGTHCAGLAVAATDNGKGIASLGFSARIIPVKACSNQDSGNTLSHAYEGLDYAISAGADVVSMSFGGSTEFLTWQVLINTAQARGIVLVAAAGNDNSTAPHYPAAYNYVIAVGATDIADRKAGFSNYGAWIDVMAPGNSIMSTLPEGNNTYGYQAGTSMSTPIVASLAALVLAVNKNYSPAQVENFIVNGCDDITLQNPNYPGLIGAGRINAFKTMAQITVAGIARPDPASPILYPNPAGDKLEIIVSAKDGLNARLHSMDGMEVAVADLVPDAAGYYSLDLGHVSPGLYLLLLGSGELHYPVQKILVQKVN